jgi:ComF family protein
VPKLRNHCGCANLDHIISQAQSAYIYDGWVATAVKRVKYHGEPARAEHLASLMLPALLRLGTIDGLIPVPLHASRERQRGYNQAMLLAEGLASSTGVPLLNVLRRSRETASQTKLSGHERIRNVSGVFSVDPAWAPPQGGRYVLIDDVRTTGATLNSCADALRSLHPAMLGVLTFALDVHREQIEELRQYEASSKANGVNAPAAPATSLSAPIHLPRGRHRAP